MTKTHSKIFILALVAIPPFISSCVYPLTKESKEIIISDYSMVESCIFLGEVNAFSGFGGLFAAAGVQDARNQALEDAAELGATNVIWDVSTGGSVPQALGRAYKCR